LPSIYEGLYEIALHDHSDGEAKAALRNKKSAEP
jgi:hypothetical protein